MDKETQAHVFEPSYDKRSAKEPASGWPWCTARSSKTRIHQCPQHPRLGNTSRSIYPGIWARFGRNGRQVQLDHHLAEEPIWSWKMNGHLR